MQWHKFFLGGFQCSFFGSFALKIILCVTEKKAMGSCPWPCCSKRFNHFPRQWTRLRHAAAAAAALLARAVFAAVMSAAALIMLCSIAL